MGELPTKPAFFAQNISDHQIFNWVSREVLCYQVLTTIHTSFFLPDQETLPNQRKVSCTYRRGKLVRAPIWEVGQGDNLAIFAEGERVRGEKRGACNERLDYVNYPRHTGSEGDPDRHGRGFKVVSG